MPKQQKVPKPRFNLKNWQDKETLISLVYRYKMPGQEKTQKLVWSTGEKINPKHWSKKDGEPKAMGGRRDYVELTKRLRDYGDKAQEIFMEYDFGSISLKEFKQELSYRTEKEIRPDQRKDLFSFIEDYVTSQKNKANAKRGTWKKLEGVANHLKDFQEETERLLTFDSFDFHFLHDFTEWLYDAPREHSTNTVSKVISVIKQFLREAHRRNLHENLIFNDRKFGVKRVKTKNKVRFTMGEIDQLIQYDFTNNPRLERTRDLFLVGCFTGLRFSDWHKIRPEQVLKEDGVKLIDVMMDKTEATIIIPFLPQLEIVLENYDYSLPGISSQKFNDYIKEVIEIVLPEAQAMRVYSKAGKTISEWTHKFNLVSSHAARRSFATNFWEMGVPAPMIMQITGHTTEKVFFDYIDINQKTSAKSFAKIVAEKMISKKL